MPVIVYLCQGQPVPPLKFYFSNVFMDRQRDGIKYGPDYLNL